MKLLKAKFSPQHLKNCLFVPKSLFHFHEVNSMKEVSSHDLSDSMAERNDIIGAMSFVGRSMYELLEYHDQFLRRWQE